MKRGTPRPYVRTQQQSALAPMTQVAPILKLSKKLWENCCLV